MDDIRNSKGNAAAEKFLDDAARRKRNSLKLSKEAEDLLQKYADDALHLWPKLETRPGVVAILEGKLNGKIKRILDYTAKGLPKGKIMQKLHPLVLDWLKNAPTELLNIKTHGKCAENFTVSQWLFEAEATLKLQNGSISIEKAREMFQDVISKSTRIYNSEESKLAHGLTKSACESCNPMLTYFNIKH